MLSTKLKSWVESHLTRKKSAGSKKSSQTMSGSHCSGYVKESPADRITHPAASLVNLVPAVPLCSSSGRSNAGLVIRLQNDFAAASAISSPCNRSHPSWSRSPVMMAWNTKIQPKNNNNNHHHHHHHQQQQQPLVASPLLDPPISPPPSASSTLQNGEPSPSGSDWTSKSFAGESGIGGGGSLASSKATDSSMCTADFDSACGRINAPSLSSPESAYSTGCSDGVSPSQDGLLFDSVHPTQNLILDAVWRRSVMSEQADGSGTNSSSTQSPRTRPAIRTNPWLPIRTSLTSSDRTSWMTDTTTEAILASDLPATLKETDIVSSGDDDDEELDNDPVAAEAARAAANAELDQLCNSLELLMDGDQLRVISQQPSAKSNISRAPSVSSANVAGPVRKESCDSRMDRRWEVDDQYTQLIRQTEEILLQLEKDELLLASRKQQPEEEDLVVNGLLHPSAVSGTGRPGSCERVQQQQPQRRRLRKTAAMRRNCSSRNSACRDDIYSSSDSDSSLSDDGVEFGRSAGYSQRRRMLPATPSDVNANRRPKSVNRNSGSRGITPRFATRQNGRVLPHLSSSFSSSSSCSAQQQQQLLHPAAVSPTPTGGGGGLLHLATPSRDRWILNSQLTSCSPDDWTTEHDRPPSPAPMDPHCHWPSTVQLRESRARSPSVSSCSSSRRNRNSNNNNGVSSSSTHRQSYRRLSGASCPSSPAVRCSGDSWDSMSARGAYVPPGRRWRQSLTREQQRLESQIAFLRRQLKDVTDDYYYDDRRGSTPSSSDSDSPPF